MTDFDTLNSPTLISRKNLSDRKIAYFSHCAKVHFTFGSLCLIIIRKSIPFLVYFTGTDLENITLNNAAQGFAIFEQVAHAIAIAEQTFMFEHRDLHWGNILVRECQEKVLVFFNGSQRFEVETMAVRATIIDFSLRLVLVVVVVVFLFELAMISSKLSLTTTT